MMTFCFVSPLFGFKKIFANINEKIFYVSLLCFTGKYNHFYKAIKIREVEFINRWL